MDVKQVIENFKTIVTRHYADFNGRASRAVFWQFVLVYVVAYVVLGILWKVLAALLSLALFLPSLGVSIRRLHDIGKSGWWILLPLGPWIVMGIFMFVFWPIAVIAGLAGLICSAYLIYLYVQPGAAEPNQFGPQTATA
jgi:uncharacterized membrane protein YhaH (DUF805 family)